MTLGQARYERSLERGIENIKDPYILAISISPVAYRSRLLPYLNKTFGFSGYEILDKTNATIYTEPPPSGKISFEIMLPSRDEAMIVKMKFGGL